MRPGWWRPSALSVGGEGGSGNGTNDGDGGTAPGALIVVATEFAFEPSTLSSAQGTVTVELRNQGVVEHDFVIEGTGIRILAAAGQTERGSVSLPPGAYRVICSIPGHLEAGMEGSLIVG